MSAFVDVDGAHPWDGSGGCAVCGSCSPTPPPPRASALGLEGPQTPSPSNSRSRAVESDTMRGYARPLLSRWPGFHGNTGMSHAQGNRTVFGGGFAPGGYSRPEKPPSGPLEVPHQEGTASGEVPRGCDSRGGGGAYGSGRTPPQGPPNPHTSVINDEHPTWAPAASGNLFFWPPCSPIFRPEWSIVNGGCTPRTCVYEKCSNETATSIPPPKPLKQFAPPPPPALPVGTRPAQSSRDCKLRLRHKRR